METITEIKVEQEAIDELEHVNNSVYVTYLEKARGDWYRDAGISFNEMRKRLVSTVVLKLEILYIQEAKLGEILKVKTSPIRLGNKSFVFQQDIYNQSGKKIVEALVTNVMIDRSVRKSIPVIKEIARFFRASE
ncbi:MULTISPECIES: acyl-CoA thioesterase [Neobacillus]|uniref:Acyl-CoA thioesterase n=1 Tax=Neobacillus rhizophilus TaxID=2833579 RepID=A0A942UCB5_9BACI|nr:MULTISPECIES: thioesterase family protein [Neobacillus]MBS4214704.1 acyl-CoA thioesterase [Neobacillus rhizophilus]